MQGVTRLFSLGIATVLMLLVSVAGYAAMVDYYMPNGQKVMGEVVGNKLMLKGGIGGMSAAPDGVYKGGDGKSIIVQGGIIVPRGMQNPGAAKMLNPQPLPPGGGNQIIGEEGSKATRGGIIVQGGKPTNPGEAKGFNPQPDPPGKSKGAVGPLDSQGVVSPRDSKASQGAWKGTNAIPPICNIGPGDSKARQGTK